MNHTTYPGTVESATGKQAARPYQSASLKVYILLVIVLVVLTELAALLPQGTEAMLQGQEMPEMTLADRLILGAVILVGYGGLGLVGLLLARRLGFAEIIDPRVTNFQRYIRPLLIGVGLGVFFILADALLSRFHSAGVFAHPPFPTSLVASGTAGIGEEILFRLFLIPVWTWVISRGLLRGRYLTPVFWVVSVFSAAAFAVGHVPALTVLLGIGMDQLHLIPWAIWVEIFLLNGILALFAAYNFRKYGFLTAVGIHFWTDVVWHVIWGAVVTWLAI